VIENTNDSDFLKAFYQALNSVTIIDPTCGSGAFLFAAMNILEEIYRASLQRMENFIDDEDRRNIDNDKTFAHKFPYFRDVLKDVKNEAHPNRQYFVYKSIILRNLYGVDIMKEAVEIAKLRLFLKLVATVEANYSKPNLGLEPLPDIDFNIRAGNTLIGFATESEIDKAFSGKFDFDNDAEKVKEKCEIVARTFTRYKDIQLSYGNDFDDFKDAKNELNNRLKELNEELSGLLHKQTSSLDYDKWYATHQPFHWFAEFYEIIHDKGGFDVIIGNPPYVNFKKVDYQFRADDYKCIDCKDLFAITIERSFVLNKDNGRNGFIVPLSGLSTETMLSLRNYLFSNTSLSWNSYYSASDQPASLFSGVRHRLLITLNEVGKSKEAKRYSTNFLKWFSNERQELFSAIVKYEDISTDLPLHSKISTNTEKSILLKLGKQKTLEYFVTKSGSKVYYHNAPVHWGKIFDFVPFFSIGGVQQQSSHLKEIYLKDKKDASGVICLLNSSLFYWFNWQYSNCRDLSQKDIFRMPISLNLLESDSKDSLVELKTLLMDDLKKNSKVYRRVSNDILTEFDSFYPLFSKPIIDEIDKVLAEHYGFSEEELDFIINYDIKYRMGKGLDGESDDESKQSQLAFS